MKPHVVAVALLTLALAAPGAPARAEKDVKSVSTSGPPVALSAEQLAQIAAKQLQTTMAARPQAPVEKQTPVVTILSSNPGSGSLKPAGASATARPQTVDEVRARLMTIDLVRAILGPSLSAQAGLVKTGDRTMIGPITSRPSAAGARP
jgi:hypothetical protein